jgi:hypothetical protein
MIGDTPRLIGAALRYGCQPLVPPGHRNRRVKDPGPSGKADRNAAGSYPKQHLVTSRPFLCFILRFLSGRFRDRRGGGHSGLNPFPSTPQKAYTMPNKHHAPDHMDRRDAALLDATRALQSTTVKRVADIAEAITRSMPADRKPAQPVKAGGLCPVLTFSAFGKRDE